MRFRDLWQRVSKQHNKSKKLITEWKLVEAAKWEITVELVHNQITDKQVNLFPYHIKIWLQFRKIWGRFQKDDVRHQLKVCKMELGETWNHQISSKWVVFLNLVKTGLIILFQTKKCKIPLWQVKLYVMCLCCNVYIMQVFTMNLYCINILLLIKGLREAWMSKSIRSLWPICQRASIFQISKLVLSDVVKWELLSLLNWLKLRTNFTISSLLFQPASPIFFDHFNKSLELNVSLITKRLQQKLI